ncbi:MAG: hypothetical protein GJ676_05105 [Rhodobacteraceae bacterium]|nr:hypothetical protein [Paracoccaceae bacterium]
MSDLGLFILPSIIAVVFAAFGYWLGISGRKKVGLIGSGIALILLGLFVLNARGMEDPWAAIAVTALAVLGFGPVVLGLVLGICVGWWRQR